MKRKFKGNARKTKKTQNGSKSVCLSDGHGFIIISVSVAHLNVCITMPQIRAALFIFVSLLAVVATSASSRDSLVSLLKQSGDFTALAANLAETSANVRLSFHLFSHATSRLTSHGTTTPVTPVQSVTKALESKLQHTHIALHDVDVESLKFYTGPAIDVAVQVGGQTARIYKQEGDDTTTKWISVRNILPSLSSSPTSPTPTLTTQAKDWASVEKNIIAPLRDGAALGDFTLEGPLDLYLTHPTYLQLWMPHNVEVGPIKRILLRADASVTVRGARSVSLRRLIDLPSISASDFLGFAMSDKERKHAAGLMHLAMGVREQAATRWNASSSSRTDDKHKNREGMSPAVVSLRLDFNRGGGGGTQTMTDGATLFSGADADTGALQRLHVRRLQEGVIEILPRYQHESIHTSTSLAMHPNSPFIWPLKSLDPSSPTSTMYEGVLRELVSRQVFRDDVGGGSSGDGSGVVRAIDEVPVVLKQTSVEAMLLMQVRLTLDRHELQPDEGGEEFGESRFEDIDSDPPTPHALFISAMGGAGTIVRPPPRHHQKKKGGGGGQGSGSAAPGPTTNKIRETWDAVVRIDGSARTGLKMVPVGLKLVERSSATMSATFAPEALPQLMRDLYGGGGLSNYTSLVGFGGGGSGMGLVI